MRCDILIATCFNCLGHFWFWLLAFVCFVLVGFGCSRLLMCWVGLVWCLLRLLFDCVVFIVCVVCDWLVFVVWVFLVCVFWWFILFWWFWLFVLGWGCCLSLVCYVVGSCLSLRFLWFVVCLVLCFGVGVWVFMRYLFVFVWVYCNVVLFVVLVLWILVGLVILEFGVWLAIAGCYMVRLFDWFLEFVAFDLDVW